MSKFLDSRFNKISYLTPLSFFILYHPKNSLLWGRIRGRFRRVASYVLVSKNACPLRGISDGPDGPKFDVRARGFPLALPPPRRRAGCCPFRCSLRSAPGGHPPAAGLGRAVSASRVRFARPRNPRHARPAGCAWLRLLGRPLTLPHPQNAPTGLSEPRGYVQAAFRGHRAPNSPRRASTASRRAFWACMVFTSSASVVSRSAPAPQPVRL